ncbi:MAG: energy-coupling factor transport system ATP-binding protein, partial [Nocardioidaceae bacterium]|nr:energy-coupling factor transport system ATP-binding protein [Nocardioidaceae bacterium]
MIEWRDVTFRYAQAEQPTLRHVDLCVDESELVLLAGRTGSGKSTLLRTVNGLVPHFSGGHFGGDVLVDGASVRDRTPRELADLVGYVGQDPVTTFVSDVVEEELAYGMEQLGLDPQTMRRRVEETLDLLGIADLRRRALRTLSGGQQQRVAIGAVLTMHPRMLVLDEPTSALDPTAAEDVLSTVARLVEDLGLTVLLAEHRMERVVPFADRLVLIEDAAVRSGPPAAMLESSPVAPPVVELGRAVGWRPLPLTVREARRRAREVVAGLGEPPVAQERPDSGVALEADRVVVRYGATVAVREVSLSLARGQVVALMGRNGSGKSSLLWSLQGAGRRDGGTVRVEGADPASVTAEKARALVGLVPQTAADLLYLETVDEECAAADAQSRADAGTCRGLLDRFAPGVDGARHPRDLSEGQRLSLVLAIVLTARPTIAALDEPTRGLDYAAKGQLAEVVSDLAREGHGVILATHDVEFVAHVADRVVVMAGGEVVSAGPTAKVLAESPAFAPQMSKVLGAGWLTVAQVRAA